MTTFDLLLRGGTVIDGTGEPAIRADVGVLGDRILAVGDLSVVDATTVPTVLDCTGRTVTPGFIDPHGHSDGSLFVDGALASHLHQGFTTQLSGNCGDTLAPLTGIGRELIELSLRPDGLVARWESFAADPDRVRAQALVPTLPSAAGQAPARGAETPGPGPGLGPARAIARAERGDVQRGRSDAAGTEFSLMLPVEDASGARRLPLPSSSRSLTRPRISRRSVESCAMS